MAHLKSHDESYLTKFQCGLCLYKGVDKWNLERHMSRNHKAKSLDIGMSPPLASKSIAVQNEIGEVDTDNEMFEDENHLENEIIDLTCYEQTHVIVNKVTELIDDKVTEKKDDELTVVNDDEVKEVNDDELTVVNGDELTVVNDNELAVVNSDGLTAVNYDELTVGDEDELRDVNDDELTDVNDDEITDESDDDQQTDVNENEIRLKDQTVGLNK